MNKPKTIYILHVDEAGGGMIETFEADVPFPRFEQGDDLSLPEHNPSQWRVDNAEIVIGHSKDQTELRIKTVLKVTPFQTA